jgi:ATP phosphoribosyltransferase regulatory subunit
MKKRHESWMLPDGIQELTPEYARAFEELRQQVLTLFANWGYDLFHPPLLEFMESLLIGNSADLDGQTFKFTDQSTGKTLGLRADITPQAVRMDAHVRRKDEPDRLCYAGPVSRTRESSIGARRNPYQIGAELFGYTGIAADIEALQLMIEMLGLSGITDIALDIGHIGVFRAVSKSLNLSKSVKQRVVDIFQRKAGSELASVVSKEDCQALAPLLDMYGDRSVIDEARRHYQQSDIQQVLDELDTIVDRISSLYPDQPINIDLAELRGYKYHNGLLFAAYTPTCGSPLALGGRYDNIGTTFGRSRPATGFSADLFKLLNLSGKRWQKTAIFAPASEDPQLLTQIRDLRAQGHTVIMELPDQQGTPRDMGCDRMLQHLKNQWQVVSL